MKPSLAFSILSVATAVTTLSQANALPLVAESAALNIGSALTLYPDHLDKNKFYFMPNSSMIARDQQNIPEFTLTYTGLNNPGTDPGGFLVYVGRLTSDADQAAAIQNFLKTHPGAGVAVVPVMESTIGLSTTAASNIPLQSMFTEFNFSQKGGRAEDEVGVTAVLTKFGAKILKASILQEAGAIAKFDECYKFQGLGPAMDAQISVDMTRTYDHFAAMASAGGWWWRASIKTEVEKLRTEKAVSWVINGGDATEDEYVREAMEKIVATMFTPQLNMTPTAGGSVWDQMTPFSFGGTYTHKEESDIETWTVTKRDLVTPQFCVPLPIKDIRDYKNNTVIDADAN